MTNSEIYNLLFNGGNYSKHYLIEFSHPDLETIRLVNNNEDVTLEGKTFKAANFSYNRPNSDGEGGTLEINSFDNSELIDFVEKADDQYSLKVVGIIQENGEIAKLKTYTHFFGSCTITEDWDVNFTLGRDDKLDMIFNVYMYDSDQNRGNTN